MKTRLSVAVITAVIAATASFASAAPAANDDIAASTPITEGVETRFSTVDATVEATEAECFSTTRSVWHSFTAPSTGDYAAYLTGSDHDTSIGNFNAIDDQIGCQDDAADSYDAVIDVGTLTAGDQRFFSANALTTDGTGTGSIGVVEVVAGADNFTSALDLTIRPGATTAVAGITMGTATVETGEPAACGSETVTAASTWLTFVAPSSGTWMFETKSESFIDLAVFTGNAVDDLTLEACATDDRVAVLLDAAEGTTYRIQVNTTDSDPIVVRAERQVARMTAELVDANGSGASGAVGRTSDLGYIDGEPVVAYYDNTQDELRFASRSGGVWTDVLVDDDGDGTSIDVGAALSMVVLSNNEPAIAYLDATNGELRLATRTGAVWTDTLIDDDGDGTSSNVGQGLSMIVLANGNLGVAYSDNTNNQLRFAERSGGVWTDVLVDDDGDGTSSDVGAEPTLTQFDNGDLGLIYGDDDNDQLRFARRVGTAWSDETAWNAQGGAGLAAGGLVINSDGNPVFAATDLAALHHVIGEWNGSAWEISRDLADRGVAELDDQCALPNLLINPADELHLVWTDCNEAYTMAVSVRDAEGEWETHDLLAEIYGPTSSDFRGTLGVDSTDIFGAAWTPDGRLAVTFVLDSDDRLFYAEDALVADAGSPTGSPTATSAPLDGSGSTDGFGSIIGYAWSTAPDGCTISDADSASAAVRCDRAQTGTVTLTVTDTDGLTHSDTASFEVDNTCDPTADPFDDVPASSFARADVTCIYNLGVTTGAGATTYEPNGTVTREQMAAFLARLYDAATGSPAPVVATPLTDIGTSFAAADIARIYGLGITTGATATTYDPTGTVTREQMAAFLARLFAAIDGDPAPVVSTPLADIAASFAAADIARIYGLGITTGATATTYDPTGTVTREQMASFLARLFLAT